MKSKPNFNHFWTSFIDELTINEYIICIKNTTIKHPITAQLRANIALPEKYYNAMKNIYINSSDQINGRKVVHYLKKITNSIYYTPRSTIRVVSIFLP